MPEVGVSVREDDRQCGDAVGHVLVPLRGDVRDDGGEVGAATTDEPEAGGEVGDVADGVDDGVETTNTSCDGGRGGDGAVEFGCELHLRDRT